MAAEMLEREGGAWQTQEQVRAAEGSEGKWAGKFDSAQRNGFAVAAVGNSLQGDVPDLEHLRTDDVPHFGHSGFDVKAALFLQSQGHRQKYCPYQQTETSQGLR